MQCIYQQLLTQGIPLKIIVHKTSFIAALRNVMTLAGAKIVLTDTSSLYAELPISKDTQIIQCWHAGGAYKHVGFDAKRSYKDEKAEELRIAKNLKHISYFITSSPLVSDIYAKAFRLDQKQIKCLGIPRTDIFYTLPKRETETNNIRVLYAPTFRDHGEGRFMPDLKSLKILHEKFGGSFTWTYRSHPTTEQSVPDGFINVSNKPYAETLASTDILITDYSSIFFDFLYFNKPILFYIPDYEEYIKSNRNLYFHPAELFPDTTCYEITSLIAKIRKYSQCSVDYSSIWKMYMSACDGRSTQKISDFISSL